MSFQVKYLGLSFYCNTSRILSLPHCLASSSYLAVRMNTHLGDYKSEENTTSPFFHKCGSLSADSVHCLDQDQEKLELSLGNQVNSHAAWYTTSSIEILCTEVKINVHVAMHIICNHYFEYKLWSGLHNIICSPQFTFLGTLLWFS